MVRRSRKSTKRVKKRTNVRIKKKTNVRSKKKTNVRSKMKSLKMNIDEDLYQKLLGKKRLSKNERKKLDHALFVKYCNCIKGLKYGDNNPAAYGICANSVYKNRGLELPPNAARSCK